MQIALISIIITTGTIAWAKRIDEELKKHIAQDILEEGYKIEASDLPLLANGTKKNGKKYLIPFYNLFNSMRAVKKYKRLRERVINNLPNNELTTPLTIDEKYDFVTNPTGEKALDICKSFEKQVKESAVIESIGQNGTNVYYCQLTSDNEDMEVIKVEGPMKRKSISEIKDAALRAWAQYYIDTEDIVIEEIAMQNDEPIMEKEASLTKKNKEMGVR